MKRALYFLCLGLVTVHLYRTPGYDMDMIGYFGNALLYRTQNVGELHRRVYAEVRTWPNAQALMGNSGHEEQDRSRKARAEHSEYFAEFLPCFAIRPAYNTLLFLLSPLGLTRAAVLISVISYFLIGWLIVAWTDRPLFSLLVMVIAPMLSIGRSAMSDGFALLVGLAALFLIFHKEKLLPGLLILLFSVFARTDYVVLVLPALAALWQAGKLSLWKAGVLAVLAVGCVLTINHFAGDYGLAMLYYRSLIMQPVAPGEMTASFTFPQYLAAFRHGLTLAAESFVPMFLLLGLIAWSRRSRVLPFIALAYSVLHYLAFPSFQERFFVLAYLLCAVSAFLVLRNHSVPAVWQTPATIDGVRGELIMSQGRS